MSKTHADGGGSQESKGVVTRSLPRGDNLKTSYPPDNVSGMKLPNTTGDKMGGSPTNLSHSLSGASAVQK